MKTFFLNTLLLVVSLSSLSGCISTNVKGYTGQDYHGYKIRKAVVRAPDAGFEFGELMEHSIIEELGDAGVKAESFLKMFPPTRQWTNEQVVDTLRKQGYDAIMTVSLKGSDTTSNTIGYINSGTASVYGNTAYYNGSSTAITTFHRYTSTHIKVYNVDSGRVVWVGDARTSAGGLFYMGDETQTDSLAEETVDALRDSGHL